MKNNHFEFDFPDANWFRKKYGRYMTTQEAFGGLQDDIRLLFGKFEENRKMADYKPIRMAKQYIQENYNTGLSLEGVSAQIGFNPAYFSSLFKKETGKNFMEYIMEVRIQNAKEFLVQTDINVDEIAMEVGYTDLKYFSKLFKKITGLNPSEYRKLYS
jgi:two-component system response regulator YesN